VHPEPAEVGLEIKLAEEVLHRHGIGDAVARPLEQSRSY
jgi:hypothetical protein